MFVVKLLSFPFNLNRPLHTNYVNLDKWLFFLFPFFFFLNVLTLRLAYVLVSWKPNHLKVIASSFTCSPKIFPIGSSFPAPIVMILWFPFELYDTLPFKMMYDHHCQMVNPTKHFYFICCRCIMPFVRGKT